MSQKPLAYLLKWEVKYKSNPDKWEKCSDLIEAEYLKVTKKRIEDMKYQHEVDWEYKTHDFRKIELIPLFKRYEDAHDE